MQNKDTLMREEFKACAKCERIRILRIILDLELETFLIQQEHIY